MLKRTFLLILVLALASLPGLALARPAAQLGTQQNEATFNFPNQITFTAQLTASSVIQSVVLEYGSEQLTCGEVVAKAFPEITPGTKVKASWRWDLRQSGSLPPGASIWWRWKAIDTSGQEFVSDTSTATWLDDIHKWQTLTDGDLRLHYYKGSNSFANSIMTAAKAGLALNAKDAGLKPDGIIDLYIYASTDDLREAVLYEPSWTGGQAFPDYNIVIIGINPNNSSEIDWGKDATVHELTHVLVGHLTFSCLGDVPTWLNEGLAVYSEGGLDPTSQKQLDAAIKQDKLLTVRSISGGFSEVPDKAYLSYSQSYSLVKFLVETYGQEKMTSLLTSLRDGTTIDAALQKIYGFDIDGLENAWRAAIGAPGHQLAAPTIQPTPTYVPTIVPFSGSQPQVTATPQVIPTSSFDGSNNPTPCASADPTIPSIPSLSDTPQWIWIASIVMILCCCVVAIVLIGIIIFFATRKRRQP